MHEHVERSQEEDYQGLSKVHVKVLHECKLDAAAKGNGCCGVGEDTQDGLKRHVITTGCRKDGANQVPMHSIDDGKGWDEGELVAEIKQSPWGCAARTDRASLFGLVETWREGACWLEYTDLEAPSVTL